MFLRVCHRRQRAISMPTTTPIRFTIGDPLPRIVLRDSAGDLFDSFDQTNAGRTRIYWLGAPPGQPAIAELATVLAACEADLRIVVPAPPEHSQYVLPWL